MATRFEIPDETVNGETKAPPMKAHQACAILGKIIAEIQDDIEREEKVIAGKGVGLGYDLSSKTMRDMTPAEFESRVRDSDKRIAECRRKLQALDMAGDALTGR